MKCDPATIGHRLEPGDFVEYTRQALDMMHRPGDEFDPNSYLWGRVLSVRGADGGGIVTWEHQQGTTKTLGYYLSRCDTGGRRKRCIGEVPSQASEVQS